MAKLPLNQENILFIFPHQDDEMMAYHRIRYLRNRNYNLYMVWITDGAANDPEIRKNPLIRFTIPIFSSEDDATIRRIREEESSALMRQLGIPDANLRFLAFPSGRLKVCFPEIIQTLEQIFRDLNPREIYTVPYENGQFDHDLCHAAVKFASKRVPRARLYEFPVLNIYKGVLRLHWLIPCNGKSVQRTPFTRNEENERLRLFRRIYRSQWFTALAESVASLFLAEYNRLGEPYRLVPEYDYSQRIAGATLNYRSRSVRFEDFQETVSNYLDSDS